MIKVVAMTLLASQLSHTSGEMQLSGEYFFNTKLGFEKLANGEKVSVGQTAKSFCAQRGYAAALAFYLETKDSPQVTDVFCSNLSLSRETVTPARIVIARDRAQRGLPLRDDVRNLLEKTAHLRFALLKKTDASNF